MNRIDSTLALRAGLTAALLVLPAAPVSAQANGGTSSAAREASAAITAESVAGRIAFLASDSLRGRDTPSPGLEKAAAYVVDAYRAMGLEPGGEDGTFYQRYPFLQRALARDRVALTVEGGDRDVELRHGRDFAVSGGTEGVLKAGAVVAGAGDEGDELPGAVRGRVLVAPTPGTPGRAFRIRAGQRARAAEGAGAVAVVHVLEPAWGQEELAPIAESSARPRWILGSDPGFPQVFMTREAARRALAGGPGAQGLFRDGAVSGGGRVPDLRVRLRAPLEVLEEGSPPNVAGVVRGADPALRDEYVIVSAHMDHVGVGSAVEGDSIYNGADDNASGTSVLMEVARALARLPEGPRRSVLVLHVSGEEKGLLGSRWYSEHPTVPLERVVANINVDMVASDLHRDSVVVIGKDYSSLGELVNGVHADLPELGLIPSDDIWPEQRFFFRSDHFNFARKEIPALFFFTGVHECYHRPCDEPGFVDAGKAARVARLIFHTVLEVANRDERPAWDPEGLAEVRALTR